MGHASSRLARHDPFCHLYLRTIMMVIVLVSTTSFIILLLFSLPSCLHLHVTPFSVEGAGVDASSPYSFDTSPDTDSHSGYCTSTRTFHILHAPSSDVPFISMPLPYSSTPTCCPCPWLQSRVDRRSSTRVRGESVILLAFLRACRRGGHGGICYA
jgi:hypothetical protein